MHLVTVCVRFGKRYLKASEYHTPDDALLRIILVIEDELLLDYGRQTTDGTANVFSVRSSSPVELAPVSSVHPTADITCNFLWYLGG